MKHLFRLALKYVTRQKLRTALMFLSVTLSVFVLNTFLVYTSSTIRSVRNTVAEENGEWEANLSGVLDAIRDGRSETVKSAAEAAEIISHHVAVDKCDIYVADRYNFGITQKPSEPVGFFDIELDNGTHKRVTSVMRTSRVGNLKFKNSYTPSALYADKLDSDLIVAPRWIEKAGYEVGDTITMTITPEMGTLDENSEPMLSVRRTLAEQNAKSDEFYYIIDGEEADNSERNGRRLIKKSLISLIDTYSDMDSFDLNDRETSSPVTITAKIAAFDYTSPESSSLWLITALDSNVDLSPLKDSQLPFSCESGGSCFVLTNQNASFEYDMELLLKDLGFTDDNAYEDFKYAMHGYNIELNTPYMLTSFRSVEGIGKAVPYIGAYLILLLIVWFFSRFIIDNAFEISVQERSVQFAALRIMGASKAQLATLVFTEGLFYALTALPLGIVSSTLACRYVFHSFRSVGFDTFEFYVSPLTVLICTLLCLTGVFISTYTSAMWASRKLTPAEALSYGKPKTKKKSGRKPKEKKSKLSLGSKRFMIRYTFKNIFRTKRRFIISSVAMALGVLIFTLCLQLGITLYGEVKDYIGEPKSDFYIYLSASDVDTVQKTLMDSGNFKSSHYNCHGSIVLSEEEIKKLGDDGAPMKENGAGDIYPVNLYTVDKNEFETGYKWLSDMNIPYEERDETSYAELLGVSFEDFEKGDAVLKLPQQDGSTYFGYGYTELSEPLTLIGDQGEEVRIRGLIHADYGTSILLPMNKAMKLIEDGKPMSANFYLLVKDAEHYPAAKEAINALELYTDNVYDHYKGGTGLTEFVKTIVTIALILMLSIWLCGIVSMMNTINTSALNRSRELLMMRAVGMTRKQLMGTVVLESLLFSSVSAVSGTLLSVVGYQLIMRFILNMNAAAAGTLTLAASAAANVVIALLAALPAVRTLNHSVSK